jgi:Malectin domain
MASKAAENISVDLQRAELETVLRSELFSRAPTLAHLLSYLCEKSFAGESAQIKEYSIAVDVFGRRDSFDQDVDSIVRVQANRLRKRLAEYYAGDGAKHRIQICIPIGQYVPQFEEKAVPVPAEVPVASAAPGGSAILRRPLWLALAVIAIVILATAVTYVFRQAQKRVTTTAVRQTELPSAGPVGLPVGDEIRILAGSSRSYVDRSGKTWTADTNFAGGAAVHSFTRVIWRTQDPEIYRNSRQGDFTYDIPLKPGTYELRLHFAETYYGPEDIGGGGEGSRVISVTANGKPILSNFDVIADAGGSRTADVKVFTDISPASDGMLHLNFYSVQGGRGMLSAIEILPGTSGHIRPVRILTRDSAYYSNDSRWWSPDDYFKGGQLFSREDSVAGTDDSELYEGERWGNFSYAIPVPPGRYNVTLHFIERRFGPNNRDKYFGPPHDPNAGVGARVFSVYCNGKTIVRDLDIFKEVGENRPLVRTINGLEPNAQGKLVLQFVPIKDYATVTAIEVLPE